MLAHDPYLAPLHLGTTEAPRLRFQRELKGEAVFARCPGIRAGKRCKAASLPSRTTGRYGCAAPGS